MNASGFSEGEGVPLSQEAREVTHRHMVEKSARDILSSIKEWTGNRVDTAKRRWVFELIQNATDTARARGKPSVDIEITQDDTSVTFKHSGGFFTLDEISAVVYGGSTKPFTTSEYIGRFGTGFLVSHIISRAVQVRGCVQDRQKRKYRFAMEICRTGSEPGETTRDIERCFSQLDNAQLLEPQDQEDWTEFVYSEVDDLGLEAIEVGIDELKRNMPFVFSFSNVREIVIAGERFVKSSNNSQMIQFVEIGSDKVFLNCDEENDLQVGVLATNGTIRTLKGIPKVYVGMPLSETVGFVKIPFVINCSRFVPTKDRNALSSADGDRRDNHELLKSAFQLYYELVEEIVDQGTTKQLHNLIDFEPVPDGEVSENELWRDFNELVRRTLTEICDSIPLVQTLDGAKAPTDVVFPLDKAGGKPLEQESFRKLYDLTADPGCWENLASDPTYEPQLLQYRERLHNEMKSTADPELPIFSF